MTFILFPYLFFCFTWPQAILKRCIVGFVSGCFFACVYLIGRAFIHSVNGQPEYFFYTLFSEFIHASYFSMYLMLAIAFVVLLYDKWFRLERSVIYSSYFFIAIFITTIFLCSSKLGLISFFLCSPLLIFYRWRNSKGVMKLAVALVVILLGVMIFYSFFPDSFGRLGSLSTVTSPEIDKNSAESTAVRRLIWGEATQLIKQNLIFGTGVADANDELYKAYQSAGLSGAYDHKLNAHNQFLQTFIGIGIPGILLLLILTLGQVIAAMRKRHFLLFYFSLLIVMNFLVESMLQRSAGVLFFVFFYCFFNLVNEEELCDDTVFP